MEKAKKAKALPKTDATKVLPVEQQNRIADMLNERWRWCDQRRKWHSARFSHFLFVLSLAGLFMAFTSGTMTVLFVVALFMCAVKETAQAETYLLYTRYCKKDMDYLREHGCEETRLGDRIWPITRTAEALTVGTCILAWVIYFI